MILLLVIRKYVKRINLQLFLRNEKEKRISTQKSFNMLNANFQKKCNEIKMNAIEHLHVKNERNIYTKREKSR